MFAGKVFGVVRFPRILAALALGFSEASVWCSWPQNFLGFRMHSWPHLRGFGPYQVVHLRALTVGLCAWVTSPPPLENFMFFGFFLVFPYILRILGFFLTPWTLLGLIQGFIATRLAGAPLCRILPPLIFSPWPYGIGKPAAWV